MQYIEAQRTEGALATIPNIRKRMLAKAALDSALNTPPSGHIPAQLGHENELLLKRVHTHWGQGTRINIYETGVLTNDPRATPIIRWMPGKHTILTVIDLRHCEKKTGTTAQKIRDQWPQDTHATLCTLTQTWAQGIAGIRLRIDESGEPQFPWKLPPEPEYDNLLHAQFLKEMNRWWDWKNKTERQPISRLLDKSRPDVSKTPLDKAFKTWLQTKPWENTPEWLENPLTVLQPPLQPPKPKRHAGGSLADFAIAAWPPIQNSEIVKCLARSELSHGTGLKEAVKILLQNILQPFNILQGKHSPLSAHDWLLLPNTMHETTWNELAARAKPHIVRSPFNPQTWEPSDLARCKTDREVLNLITSPEFGAKKPFDEFLEQAL